MTPDPSTLSTPALRAILLTADGKGPAAKAEVLDELIQRVLAEASRDAKAEREWSERD